MTCKVVYGHKYRDTRNCSHPYNHIKNFQTWSVLLNLSAHRTLADCLIINRHFKLFSALDFRRVTTFSDFFFLTSIWLPQGQIWAIYQGDSLTHPMLIIAFPQFWPWGHWEPRSEVRSLSLAELLVGIGATLPSYVALPSLLYSLLYFQVSVHSFSTSIQPYFKMGLQHKFQCK